MHSTSIAMEYAYLTLVMKVDEYVIGALVLARSLRLTGTKHIIACMVTNDVSDKAMINLQLEFDRVHVVDYYHAKRVKLRTDKAEGMYSSWMDISLTWYQCLNLVRYEKDHSSQYGFYIYITGACWIILQFLEAKHLL